MSVGPGEGPFGHSKRTRLLNDDISDITGDLGLNPQPVLRSSHISAITVTGHWTAADEADRSQNSPPTMLKDKMGSPKTIGRRTTSRATYRSGNTSWSTGDNKLDTSSEEVTSGAGLPRIPEMCEQGHAFTERTITIDDERGTEIRGYDGSVSDRTFVVSEGDSKSVEDASLAKQVTVSRLGTSSVNKSTTASGKASSLRGTVPGGLDGSATTRMSRHSRPYGQSNRSETFPVENVGGSSLQTPGNPREAVVSIWRSQGTKEFTTVLDEAVKEEKTYRLSPTTLGSIQDISKAPSRGRDLDHLSPEATISGAKSAESLPRPSSKRPSTETPAGQEKKAIKRREIKDIPDRLFPASSAPAGLLREEEYKKSLGDAVVTFFATSVTEDAKKELKNIHARVEPDDKGWDASEEAPATDEIVVATVHEDQSRENVAPQPETVSSSGRDQRNEVQERPRNIILIKRELCLYPISILLCLAIMAVAIIFIFPNQPAAGRQFLQFMLNKTSNPRRAGHRGRDPVCGTAACAQDAAFLDGLLSWNVDPCDNFYKFVCNRWTSEYSATDEKVSTEDDYMGQFEARMYTVLQNLTKDNNLLLPLRSLFRECVSTKDLEASGWDPLLELLALTSLEGFPFTPPVRSSFSVWKIAAKVLKMTGAAALLSVDVVSHPTSKDKDIIALDVPETIVSSNGGDINEAIRCYYSVVYTAVKALRKEFIPPVHTMQIVNFAFELEHLFLEKQVDNKPTINKLSTNPELVAFTSEIFEGVASPAYNGASSDVLLKSPDFISGLIDVVKKVEPHIVMNFLGVRLMIHISAFTPHTELVDVYASLMYHRPKTSIPRWKLCVRVVEHAMPPLFLLATLLDVRIQSVTTDLSKLVKAIVDEVVRSLDNAVFLDEASKVAAKNIVATTRYRVLGPAWIGEKNVVEVYLGAIPKMVRGQGLMSYVAQHQHTFSVRISQSSGNRWTSSVFRTDCWNENHPKTTYVPTLLFNVSLRATVRESQAFQLPRAGIRLAHCIFRMLFDETDSDSWMNEESRGRIEEALRCLGNQYGSEDAAQVRRLEDNAVILPTFRHFVEIIQRLENKSTLHLPRDRDLSPQQLFFVYLMLQSCERTAVNVTSNAEDSGLSLNVPLQNEPGFHEAFECSTSSRMNPPEKCVLWMRS